MYDNNVPELKANPVPYKNSAIEKEIIFLNKISNIKLQLIIRADKFKTFSLPTLSDRYPDGKRPIKIPML